MSKYTFIDNIFGSDDEEATDHEDLTAEDWDQDDEARADDDEDDDEGDPDDEGDADDDGEEEEDEDLPAEDADVLVRLDKEFRKVRARIRASTDPSELRTLRNEHTASLVERLSPMLRLRTEDIIEEIDARVTDLRARRGRST
jgi:hypothetical protein